jgi:hypothetical protein
VDNKLTGFGETLYEHELPRHDRPAYNPMIKNTNMVTAQSSEGETTVSDRS